LVCLRCSRGPSSSQGITLSGFFFLDSLFSILEAPTHQDLDTPSSRSLQNEKVNQGLPCEEATKGREHSTSHRSEKKNPTSRKINFGLRDFMNSDWINIKKHKISDQNIIPAGANIILVCLNAFPCPWDYLLLNLLLIIPGRRSKALGGPTQELCWREL
jgi:hypothetical protein